MNDTPIPPPGEDLPPPPPAPRPSSGIAQRLLARSIIGFARLLTGYARR